MPTFERTSRFDRDFKRLTHQAADLFVRVVIDDFVPAVAAGPPYPRRLRMKRVMGTAADWEMTWDSNGRATYQFGEPIRAGEPHVVWLRVGDHSILP